MCGINSENKCSLKSLQATANITSEKLVIKSSCESSKVTLGKMNVVGAPT